MQTASVCLALCLLEGAADSQIAFVTYTVLSFERHCSTVSRAKVNAGVP